MVVVHQEHQQLWAALVEECQHLVVALPELMLYLVCLFLVVIQHQSHMATIIVM